MSDFGIPVDGHVVAVHAINKMKQTVVQPPGRSFKVRNNGEIGDQDYFLSPSNPIANIDQRDLDARAMRIKESPPVRKAKELARARWLAVSGDEVNAKQRALFDAELDEWVFNYVLKAVNSDANYPRVLRNWLPPHRWFGMQVDGARIGGDNPDVAYRIIPIEHGARYEVTGLQTGAEPADVSWTLVKDFGTTKTAAFLDGQDMVRVQDGRFTVFIDAEPANGRANHLRTQPGVMFLYIRDALSDWAAELPNALRVRRITLPSRAPFDDQEIAEIAAEKLLDDVPLYHWFNRLLTSRKPNTMSPPQLSGWGGWPGFTGEQHGIDPGGGRRCLRRDILDRKREIFQHRAVRLVVPYRLALATFEQPQSVADVA